MIRTIKKNFCLSVFLSCVDSNNAIKNIGHWLAEIYDGLKLPHLSLHIYQSRACLFDRFALNFAVTEKNSLKYILEKRDGLKILIIRNNIMCDL